MERFFFYTSTIIDVPLILIMFLLENLLLLEFIEGGRNDLRYDSQNSVIIHEKMFGKKSFANTSDVSVPRIRHVVILVNIITCILASLGANVCSMNL